MPRKKVSKKEEIDRAPDKVLLTLLIIVSILSFFTIFLYPVNNQSTTAMPSRQALIAEQEPKYHSFEQAYSAFMESRFLGSKWKQACENDISAPEELMFMAKVERNGDEYKISCVRGLAYSPIEMSDVPYDWDNCHETPSNTADLAYRVYKELHEVPYPLVHLTKTLPERETDLAFVIVTNCHLLEPDKMTESIQQFCTENNIYPCSAKSAVYGVLDAYTGRTYW
ncbi:hypothetical protein C4561_00040 [candidate division WWE3 bacterium]|jgi:hypothetical protein|uniref:Uncharacterized protein n=1 Tax=candidate division WWE3 bacterium TaxID=2053526 RepID=A0A3A4ZGY1_UNCKA|nr:MAG: hypothetical protein C4561_00040 [candidate division WWE3 bacterium]